MIPAVARAVASFTLLLAAAEPHAPAKTRDGNPVIVVPVRRDSTPYCLSKKVASEKYAKDFPEPFVYKADADQNETCAFVVAGLNSDDCLAKTKSITGIDLGILERRMRPNRAEGSDAGSSVKPSDEEAWKGANNFSMRVSTEGFLDRKQSLRDLLRADNKFVLDKKLTHQKVAAPLLRIVENLRKSGKNEITYLGRYEVKRKRMAGGVLRRIDDPKKADDEGRCDSGWIGAGVQGSPFDDELFANALLEIVDTKTQQKLVIDELTPHLIYRYGFYQGGKYRVPPTTLIDFFDLAP